MTDFEKELIVLLNKYNQEPNDILAAYLINCLIVWDDAAQRGEIDMIAIAVTLNPDSEITESVEP